jgi:hypothetical protein
MSQEALKPFLGKWTLSTKESIYQLGQPPDKGTYLIEDEGDKIKVTMDWTAVDGKSFHQLYFGVLDGEDHPYHDNPMIDSMSMTLVSNRRMDSDAKKDGEVVSYATRELSEDGHVMTITMMNYTLTGTFTNVAIYKRST